MNTKKFLFYMIAAILGGCIPIMSIEPFFTESDILFEEKLLGSWVDDVNDPNTTWIFSRYEGEPNETYQLTYIDKEGNKGSYITVLMKLDNTLYLDVFPNEMPWDTEDPNKVEFVYNTIFLAPVNTILKVDAIEPQLLLKLTEEDRFKELMDENPKAVDYKEIGGIGGKIVLTSSTMELQEFVLKYADDERLFPDEIILVRKAETTISP